MALDRSPLGTTSERRGLARSHSSGRADVLALRWTWWPYAEESQDGDDVTRCALLLCKVKRWAPEDSAISTSFQAPLGTRSGHVSGLSVLLALFRVSRTQFMSNQLYGDAQTMVKNAVFSLAKQNALDPTQPFYLFHVGDDPLERLFGKLRMLGGHNSAMNYAQAIDRLGHAADLQGAFMRNPDLDQGERRLNMSRSEGVDHLTMKSFDESKLIAGDCHQTGAWDDGKDIAIAILKKSAVASKEYNFDTIFADGVTDMLAPFGNRMYPGVDTSEPDRSILTPDPAPTPSSTDVLMPDSTQDPESDDDGDVVSLEESIDPEATPQLQLPSGPGITPDDYLSVDAKWVHKQRICRLVISKDFEPKSIVRLLRVRGHGNVNAKPRDDTNIDPSVFLRKDTFFVGDPILTLLRTETKVSVAVLRTTGIHQDGISRSSILTTTIKNPAAKVKITGQVYSLTLIRKTAAPDFVGPIQTNAMIRAKNWLESEGDSEWAWIWNGEYLKVDAVMRGTSGADKVATDKVVLVSVPGVLTELVNPTMVDAENRLGQLASRINSLGQSWEIDDKQLGLVADLLWGQAVENNVSAASITPVSKTSEAFPYVFDDGTHLFAASSEVFLIIPPGNAALLSSIPTQQLTHEHVERLNRVCELCGEKAENQYQRRSVKFACHVCFKAEFSPHELSQDELQLDPLCSNVGGQATKCWHENPLPFLPLQPAFPPMSAPPPFRLSVFDAAPIDVSYSDASFAASDEPLFTISDYDCGHTTPPPPSPSPFPAGPLRGSFK
ncbi:hypothetical protein DFH09DRAFT_1076515 [Mycena vulgaris]|nr:hypothetical protein DFH09DRAFT_1076515 [Mycena vulgaris]